MTPGRADLPAELQQAIAEHEAALTAELRRLTGRDDITAEWNDRPILEEPAE